MSGQLRASESFFSYFQVEIVGPIFLSFLKKKKKKKKKPDFSMYRVSQKTCPLKYMFTIYFIFIKMTKRCPIEYQIAINSNIYLSKLSRSVILNWAFLLHCLLTIALSFCQSKVYIQCHETFESFAKYIHDRVHAFSLQTVR